MEENDLYEDRYLGDDHAGTVDDSDTIEMAPLTIEASEEIICLEVEVFEMQSPATNSTAILKPDEECAGDKRNTRIHRRTSADDILCHSSPKVYKAEKVFTKT